MVHPLGLSLDGFKALVNELGASLAGRTTAWLKFYYILPATAAAKQSYCAMRQQQDTPHVRPANKFVSHAYDYLFLDVFEAIAQWEAAQPPGSPCAYYYFDLFAVNQHGQDAIVPFEVLRDEFAGSLRAIGCTLLVLHSEDPLPLRRLWCVFEMATALRACTHRGGTVSAKSTGLARAPCGCFSVIMPPACTARLLGYVGSLDSSFEELLHRFTTVNVARATAREEQDRINITRVVRSAGGFEAVKDLVEDALKQWMLRMAQDSAEQAPLGSEARVGALCNAGSLLLLLAGDEPRLAQRVLRSAYEQSEGTLGFGHPATLRAAHYLASSLEMDGSCRKKGVAQAIIALYLQAARGRRDALGPTHEDTVESAHCLAAVLAESGKAREAMQVHVQLLLAMEAAYAAACGAGAGAGAEAGVGGASLPSRHAFHSSLRRLARLLNQRKQWEASVAVLGRGLRVCAVVHGGRGDCCALLELLAAALCALGRQGEACALFSGALKQHEERQGAARGRDAVEGEGAGERSSGASAAPLQRAGVPGGQVTVEEEEEIFGGGKVDSESVGTEVALVQKEGGEEDEEEEEECEAAEIFLLSGLLRVYPSASPEYAALALRFKELRGARKFRKHGVKGRFHRLRLEAKGKRSKRYCSCCAWRGVQKECFAMCTAESCGFQLCAACFGVI